MITLKNVTLRRHTKVLLDNANITIQPGENVGLVGRNGAGKSTLFALLNGTLHEDAGEFYRPSAWALGQVAQSMPETSASATDFVLEGDTPLMAAQAELDAAYAIEDANEQGNALAHAYTALADAGEHDARPRAQALILGLGFKVSELEKPVNSFSGGWRMRLQLARALMCPSDLLLLDEPTNHLDLDALVWLEAWLKRYEGTMIVISHDREFLDAVTRVTVHIEDGKLTRYGSNYSGFEELRSQQIVLQQAAFGKQQDQIAHLQKFIARFKAKASKAKQAQSRVKALDRMERIAPIITSADFTFEFKEPQNLPNPMLSVTDANFGYEPPPLDLEAEAAQNAADLENGVTTEVRPRPGATTILRGINKSVMAGQRIGILGANGQGKSTLVKTIAGMQPVLSGKLTEGKGLSVGYFAQQELDVLSEDSSPLEHMIRLARTLGVPAREQDLRSYLGTFRFQNDMVNQAVGTMSGGEKARMVLAMVVWQRPNLLLLDEPTNHLDLMTREALGMALNEFEGTVMLVSHDRSLLRSVCDEFWLVGEGTIRPFDGDMDDYQKYLLDMAKKAREDAKVADRAAAAAPVAVAAAPVAVASVAVKAIKTPAAKTPAEKTLAAKDSVSQAQRRQQNADKTRPWRKEIEQIDIKIAALNAERLDLEEVMVRLSDGGDIAMAGRRLKQIAQDTAELENRWLELSEWVQETTT